MRTSVCIPRFSWLKFLDEFPCIHFWIFSSKIFSLFDMKNWWIQFRSLSSPSLELRWLTVETCVWATTQINQTLESCYHIIIRDKKDDTRKLTPALIISELLIGACRRVCGVLVQRMKWWKLKTMSYSLQNNLNFFRFRNKHWNLSQILHWMVHSVTTFGKVF